MCVYIYKIIYIYIVYTKYFIIHIHYIYTIIHRFYIITWVLSTYYDSKPVAMGWQQPLEVRMRSLAPKPSQRRRLRAYQLLWAMERWKDEWINAGYFWDDFLMYHQRSHHIQLISMNILKTYILMLFQTSQRIDILDYIVLDLPWTYAFSGNRWLCYHFWSSQAGARWETVYRGFNKWGYPKIPKWKLYNGKSYIIEWIILGYPRFLGNQYIYIHV